MPQLYLVAVITGIFTVFFDVAYQSYLPALIDRGDLIEGNSKLEVTRSAAQLLGPPAAGFLIQAFQAARAIAVDALSFLASAIAVWLIRKPEPEPRPTVEGAASGFFAEMREGIAVVFRNRYLWRIAGCTATSNLGSNITMAVFLIFAYRTLHLSAGTVGVIFGVGSIGYLVGALSAQRSARLLGLGPVLAVSIVVGGLSWLLVPLALYLTPFVVLTVAILIGFSSGPIYNINQVSLRQAITPDRVQGRMNATMRTIVWGTIPVGAFLGGVLGTAIGIVETIVIGAVVSTLAVLWVGIGPVRRLREQPAPVA
jgi:predicted MFS family arabinose efflux permease